MSKIEKRVQNINLKARIKINLAIDFEIDVYFTSIARIKKFHKFVALKRLL